MNTSGNKCASRDELLSAINSLSQPNDREAMLRRYGFWKVGGSRTSWHLWIENAILVCLLVSRLDTFVSSYESRIKVSGRPQAPAKDDILEALPHTLQLFGDTSTSSVRPCMHLNMM